MNIYCISGSLLSARDRAVNKIYKYFKKVIYGGFPGGAVVKNLPANAGDVGSSPGPGGSHMPQSN